MRLRALAAISASIALSACGIDVESEPERLSPDEVLRPAERPSPAVVSTPQGSRLMLYFVRGNRVGVTYRRPAERTDLQAALDALFAGPTADEQQQGIRSAIPLDAAAIVRTAAPMAVVDVNRDFAQVEGGDQVLALAQIVFTATAIRGVQGIQLTVDGRQLQAPTPDGRLLTGALTRSHFASLTQR